MVTHILYHIFLEDFNGRADSGIMIAEIMAALTTPGRHIATESQQDEVVS